MKNKHEIQQEVEQWLQDIVIGLQLCPFAKAPSQKQQVRFFVSEAKTEEDLIEELIKECQLLDKDAHIETTIMIIPYLLSDFFDYSQYLNWAEQTLKQHQWRGIYQIASFHPHYQFAGTNTSDPQNLTNRSPYPLLHLLRENSLANILDRFPDSSTIPEKNIQTMTQLSEEQIHRYFHYLK